MDLGVYWSQAVLEHKLERLEDEGRAEEVWNCRVLPRGLDSSACGNRLFIASGGRWIGFFRLVPEVLYIPEDSGCPYALIFDVKSWRRIHATVLCRPFRGWTYKVPAEVTATVSRSAPPSPAE